MTNDDLQTRELWYPAAAASWWNAEDGSSWRWSVEFSDRRS
jgi:hypothetical protein